MRIGAVEAGGTKFVCGIGNERGEVEDRISFPTAGPEETIDQVIDYFREQKPETIGIGSFGPIDPNPASPTYGRVTTTPKQGWQNCDFLGRMKQHFSIPIGWDTDVNVAALGEATWGAAKGLANCLYLTVGTGVGGGVYAEGRLVHGLVHPEIGHIPLKRHPDDTFAGSCPYHADCLEGMAAGPSLEKRWGVKGGELGADHPAWAIEAYYLAQTAVQAILFLSPEKIILGGGVMKQRQLFPLIRAEVLTMLNGYVQHETILSGMEDYIVPPALGDNAGLCGALALGLEAVRGQGSSK